MTNEEKKLFEEAKHFYSDYFNSLPFEERKMLSTPYERWLEVNVLLNNVIERVLYPLRERERTLRNSIIEDYKEIKKNKNYDTGRERKQDKEL